MLLLWLLFLMMRLLLLMGLLAARTATRCDVMRMAMLMANVNQPKQDKGKQIQQNCYHFTRVDLRADSVTQHLFHTKRKK